MLAFRAGAFIAVCILVFAQPIWAMDSCPQDAGALVREAPAAIPELFQLVDRAGRPDGFSRWLARPLEEPHTQVLVERLISLTPAERAETLAALERHPPQNAQIAYLTKLALYDGKTWNDFFDEFTHRARYDNALANALIPVMRRMPPDLVTKLHARMREVYATLSKRSFRLFPRPAFYLRLAPKRAADAFIQHTLRPDVGMAEDIAKGATPNEALDHYFARINEILGRPPGAVYTHREVLQIARAMQNVLRDEATKRGTSDLSITIAGSFPNGRAKLEDFDLDTQVSDRSLINIFPKFDIAGNAVLNAIRSDSKLETHAMRESTTEPFAAQVNPAMLRISPDRIELLMYPPVQPLNRDEVLQPYNYPRPTVYVLEAHERGKLSIPRRIAKQTPMRAPGVGETIWLTDPHAEPDTQRLVDHLIQLPAAERERQLADFRANPPSHPEWKMTMGLALYDRATWVDFLRGAMRGPQRDDRVFNSLVPVMQKMPDDLRVALLREINQHYPTASRAKFTRGFAKFFRKQYGVLAPKRLLDVMISHLTRPTEIFEKFARTEGPVAALDRYLTFTKETALENLPNGGYRAEQIMAAAREMQKVLREKGKADGIAQPSITIAGSFPNGRANPKTSDIDVMMSDRRVAEWLPAMTEKVNAVLGSGFSLEVHAMLPTTSTHDAAIVNPVEIHISEEKIEIWVFPPFRPLPGDRYYKSENYAPPQKYLIDDKMAIRRTSAISWREFSLAA